MSVVQMEYVKRTQKIYQALWRLYQANEHIYHEEFADLSFGIYVQPDLRPHRAQNPHAVIPIEIWASLCLKVEVECSFSKFVFSGRTCVLEMQNFQRLRATMNDGFTDPVLWGQVRPSFHQVVASYVGR